WLLNNKGILFRLQDRHITESPGGGSETRKALLARGGDGQVWLAANGQVSTLHHGKAVGFSFGNTNDGEFYQAALPGRREGLWVVANGAVRKFHDGRWTQELGNLPTAETPVTALLETRAGMLLTGTLNDGLYLFSLGASPVHLSRTNG